MAQQNNKNHDKPYLQKKEMESTVDPDNAGTTLFAPFGSTKIKHTDKRKTKMLNKKQWLQFIAICFFLTACNDTSTDDADNFTTPNLQQCISIIDGYYYVAEMLPMEFLGSGFEPSHLLAITEINNNGGIHGKPLGLIACDSEGDDAKGIALTEELAGVDYLGGILGPAFSSVTLAIMETAVANNIVMVSPSATASVLTTAQDNNLFFRTDLSDALYASVAASIIDAAQIQRTFIIHPDNEWGTGLGLEFEANYPGAVKKFAYDASTENFALNAITAAKAFAPQAVYLVTYSSHTEAILTAAEEIGDFNPQWFMYDQHTDVLKKVGEYVSGASGIEIISQENNPSYQLYLNNFRTAFGDSHEPVPRAYDATYALAIAMNLSNDPTNGVQVSSNLGNISSGQIVRPNQWAEITKLTPNGQMNYEGASGPIDFDSNGDVYSNFQQWVFQNGEFSLTDCWSWEGVQISCESSSL